MDIRIATTRRASAAAENPRLIRQLPAVLSFWMMLVLQTGLLRPVAISADESEKHRSLRNPAAGLRENFFLFPFCALADGRAPSLAADARASSSPDVPNGVDAFLRS